MTTTHILVPADFSDDAEQALDYAIQLAKAFQARLSILHVIHLTPMAMGDIGAASLVPYLEDMEADAQQRLHAMMDRVNQEGLEGETVIVQGVPAQHIVEMAGNKSIDLIVMGTHGRTGLTHALIGSVAERVVRLAPCPVLVTRGTADASTTQNA